jgi:hypothetical protein
VAASYYLGPMLTNAGIKDTTKQLEIVRECKLDHVIVTLTEKEHYPECILSGVCFGRHIFGR